MRNSANSVTKIIFNCIPCHKMKKKNYTANCMLSEGIIKLLKDYRKDTGREDNIYCRCISQLLCAKYSKYLKYA